MSTNKTAMIATVVKRCWYILVIDVLGNVSFRLEAVAIADPAYRRIIPFNVLEARLMLASASWSYSELELRLGKPMCCINAYRIPCSDYSFSLYP